MDRTAPPERRTLAEFGRYQELLTETGRAIVGLEDLLYERGQRESARDAIRRESALTPDRVGRGRTGPPGVEPIERDGGLA